MNEFFRILVRIWIVVKKKPSCSCLNAPLQKVCAVRKAVSQKPFLSKISPFCPKALVNRALTLILVRKIVHFCKRLPLWANLNEDIQIRLIKGGLTEAMILFNTRDYDSKRDEVKFMDGKLRSKEAFYASGFNSEMIDGNLIWNDITRVPPLQSRKTDFEYSILIVIRPNSEKLQNFHFQV